jgi:NADPH:quinone reductase-like Zn-dependent oxidoreductase
VDGVPVGFPIGRQITGTLGHSRTAENAADLHKRSSAALYPMHSKLVMRVRFPSPALSRSLRAADGRAIFFVVEPDRLRLADLAERVRSGRLKPIVGTVRPLAEAPSTFAPDRRMPGKTIIRVTEGG